MMYDYTLQHKDDFNLLAELYMFKKTLDKQPNITDSSIPESQNQKFIELPSLNNV